MPSPTRLPRKPEARTEKVEDLVDKVCRGTIRVPWFQRGLNWQASDVRNLFDSIYRGYPIGSLLFYRRPAEIERLTVGPLVIEAPQVAEAWWVIDGQQRVTALAACLARPLPLPARPDRGDPFVLFFDAASQRFETPAATGEVSSTWVPLPVLRDASQLSEWVHHWEHGGDPALRQLVFEAGTRLREYPIPLYLSDFGERGVAEEIFYRVNNSGKPLGWDEVHKALFGGEGEFPSTLEDLADVLAEAGMGRLDKERLLTDLLALRGLDPTRTLAEHRQRDPAFLRDAVPEGLPVLRRVLSFLRQDAGVPHLRFLPKSILLDVLTCFFARHAEPNPRSRALLSRWFWRVVLGAGAYDDRTLRRRGIAAVGGDEEASVQGLLALVRKERPRAFELPESFDPRADDSRIVLLALAHLGPRELLDGAPIRVADLVEREANAAFARIVRRAGLAGTASAANRAFQRRGSPIWRLLLRRIEEHGFADPVLASHAISPEAAECLAAGDPVGFLVSRVTSLTAEARRFAERMAAWDQNDRPSIDYVLAEAGAQG